MKYTALIFLFAVALFSCKQNAPAEEVVTETTEEVVVQKLSIVNDSTTVGWTAYKTTDKAPVKGTFTQFTIENVNDAETPIDILNGASITVPMSSVFTKDTARDATLRTFFFDKLAGDIKGTLTFEEGDAFLTLTLNGVEQKFPVQYSISDDVFTLESVIQLADYKALDALKSLHKACKDLHMGADGVSKTWEEVAINGRVVFAYQ